jgi:2'-5' RNA ligase
MQEAAGEEQAGAYALVAYVPPPLGRFLDHLRAELVPGSDARSHVTVLPPRRIAGTEDEARVQLEADIKRLSPFEVNLSGVQVFQGTNVVYLSVSVGRRELQTAHSTLNRACLAFKEPLGYYPHLTLAQDFPPGQLEELADQARKRWSAWPLSQSFRVETMAFVKNHAGNAWQDLAEYPLDGRKS